MPSRYPDDWTLRAKCRGMEDALFPEGADQKRARQICMGCPVRTECLAEALDNRIEWGVWGGMTERERRQLLRQRTDIQSWRAILMGGKRRAARETGMNPDAPDQPLSPEEVDVTPTESPKNVAPRKVDRAPEPRSSEASSQA